MEKLYTAQEAAEMVGLSYDYFRRKYCKSGGDYLRDGDPDNPQSWRYRFTKAQVEKIISQKWQPVTD